MSMSAPSGLAGVSRHLGELLQQEHAGTGWLLLDLLKRPQLPACIPARGPAVTVVPLVHPAIDDDQRPRLIALDAHGVDLIEAGVATALAEQADPARESREGLAIGGWIFSRAPAQEVAQHLARVMSHPRAHAPRRRYVRWADRRAFEWMWPTLDDAERGALMGPIHGWHTVDRLGRWCAHDRPQPAVSLQRTLQVPLFTMTPHWAHADQGELVHEMVRGWLAFAGELPTDYLARAAAAVAAGQALGLSRPADLMLLGAYILQIHPRLTTHAAVRARVARALSGACLLQEALADVPDPEGWDAIRAELDAGRLASPLTA